MAGAGSMVDSTGNWAIVEAASTAVSAGLVAAGAVLARRYLRRATATVEATFHARTATSGVLHVRPCIQNQGLVRLALDDRDDEAPQIVVTPLYLVGGQELPDMTSYTRLCLEDAQGQVQVIDPGETVTGSETFPLSTAHPELLGWRVEFLFYSRLLVPKIQVRFHRERWWMTSSINERGWFWTAETFVPWAPDMLNVEAGDALWR